MWPRGHACERVGMVLGDGVAGCLGYMSVTQCRCYLALDLVLQGIKANSKTE